MLDKPGSFLEVLALVPFIEECDIKDVRCHAEISNAGDALALLWVFRTAN